METELSMFDYRRFLPVGERRKQMVINDPGELWHFQNCLMRELLWSGEDVRGYMDHMNYISEMARTNIYDIKALVAYDEAFLERARRWGAGVFYGADTNLTNTILGVSGTKAARAAAAASKPRSNQSTGSYQGNSGSRGGYQGRRPNNTNKPLSGWRKLAAERGVCFKFCLNQPCDGTQCQFKHQCVLCDSLNHSMEACPTKGPGDNRA